MSAEPVSVRILDREYTVGVGGDERDSLMAAARLLDARMREIRGSNRMAAVDRVAVLAALNLAHELQLLRDENARQAVALQQTLADLNRRLDRAIDGTPFFAYLNWHGLLPTNGLSRPCMLAIMATRSLRYSTACANIRLVP